MPRTRRYRDEDEDEDRDFWVRRFDDDEDDDEGDQGASEETGMKPIVINGVRIPALSDIRRHVKAHAWNGRDFTSRYSHYEVFDGQCEYASTALSEMLTGTGRNQWDIEGRRGPDWSLRVRGLYCGDLTHSKTKSGCDRRAFSEGKHCHSWVEFGGKIIDPTWWQFTGHPARVYVFPLDDPRFVRDDSV
jgi:hypothetical protein